MFFGKYVCVLFIVLLMRRYEIPLKIGMLDPLPPNSNGIRLLLLWQTPINAIFCGVSTDEFHRISHVKIAKKE